MKVIDFNTIKELDITPETCLRWVRDVFINKYNSILPTKVSLSQPGDVFFNTMPCCIPEHDIFGVKVVTRFPNRNPSLQAEILLYNSSNGELLAFMDGSWITMMRTGAVAAIAVDTLKNKKTNSYTFVGLGNTARATLLCLQSLYPNEELLINIYAYKGQEESFIKRFEQFDNINFVVYDNIDALFEISDVILSCITVADGIMAPEKVYKEGVLVVPIHTRGFQNCDLFFDKVYADDTEHVQNFKYFDRFKSFAELSQVLLGENEGRVSDKERILSYNIGIALHDIYFASKIYGLVQNSPTPMSLIDNKYWV